MLTEARQHERADVQIEEIDGEFQIETDTNILRNGRVLNVSISGAGIALDKPLDINTRVGITFKAGDWKIAVDGTVVWHKPTNPREGKHLPTYQMGVRFLNHNVRNNVLFFQASQSMMNPTH